MQHPFEGILSAESDHMSVTNAGRRSFLIRALGSAVAVCAGVFGFGSHATAQIYTTQALGEEGGHPGGWYPPSDRRYRSYPYGGWGRRSPRYTTYALGEEGGPYTTHAMGEEGGRYTTQAVGEEGGYYFRRRDD